MQKNNFVIAVALVSVVLTALLAASFHWGALASEKPGAEFFITRFDKKVGAGGESCFQVAINSSYSQKTIGPYFVVVQGSIVEKREVDLAKDKTVGECIPSERLSPGDNFVEIYIGGNRLFYHTMLLESRPEEKKPRVSVSFEGEDEARILVENNADLEYAPLNIFVNDTLDHSIYPAGEKFGSVERLSLREGENTVRIEFKGESAETIAVKEKKFGMNPLVGTAIISALLCALAFLVFAKYPLAKKIAYSALSFFTVLVVVFFLLELTGLLSAFNFVLSVSIITVALGFAFRENFKMQDTVGKIGFGQIKSASPLLLLLITIIVFSSIFFNFFTDSYFSDWTVFYERQSRTIAAQEKVPLTDEFSFLGTKPFGYMSAYFFINPGVSWLAGLHEQQSYAVLMLLAQIAFIASVLLLFRSFGFEEKRTYLATIALLLGGFMFSDFSFNIRHVISYSLLFLSLYFVRKNRPLQAGIALGIGTFVQTPIALMFIAALPIVLTEKKTVKTSAKSLALGSAIALLLFVPTLLRSGIPTQAEYNVWGYLWSIPLYGFFLDYLAVVALIALFIVPFLALKEVRFDRFSARVGLFLALFVFVQLFVSYRINIIATLAFALFIALLFPKRVLDNRLSEYSLSVLFGVTFALMFLIIISFYPVVPSAQQAFGFVRENTSTEANFLNEPYLGHAFIFFAERKSSADLAVEYANGEMIKDSFSFLKTGNNEILEKYNVDYVVNRAIFLNEAPVGDNLWFELLEYENLNKIYSNGLFSVHWVDKQN